jgi:hypothetical protein
MGRDFDAGCTMYLCLPGGIAECPDLLYSFSYVYYYFLSLVERLLEVSYLIHSLSRLNMNPKSGVLTGTYGYELSLKPCCGTIDTRG